MRCTWFCETNLNDLAAKGVPAQETANAYRKRRLELEAVIDKINKEIDESFTVKPNGGNNF